MAVELNLTNENIANPLAIYQGATYSSVVLLHPEDFSLWTARGQIRRNYIYLGGELLADFSFTPITWGLVNVGGTMVNRSTIIPVLTHQATSSLPVTRTRGIDKWKPGATAWVYDIELVDPAGIQVVKLARGLVEVLPEVTGVL